jgi:hypothetical protein
MVLVMVQVMVIILDKAVKIKKSFYYLGSQGTVSLPGLGRTQGYAFAL